MANSTGLYSVRSMIGLVPACVFLLAGGLLGVLGTGQLASASQLAFTENPLRLIIYGCAYLLALSLVALRWREARTMVRRSWLLWCLVAYAAASVFWSAFPLKVAVDSGHLAGVLLVATAAVLGARGDSRPVAITVLLASSIVVICSIVAVKAGLPLSLDMESGRWAGTAGNANSLGLYCAMSLGSSAYLWKCSRSFWSKALIASVASMSALALYRSNSVTSLIVAVFWIAAMLWLTARRAPAASNLKLRLITGVLVASLCFVVLAVAMPQLNILNGGLAALGRSSDLTGRLELWQYGWGRFLQRPLLGYGFDSLASILSGTNTTVGQLHNGYLDLLLRGGLLGAAVFLLSFGQLVVRALATQVVAADGAWQLVTPVAILIHNVSESSIARPVHSLWLLFLLGATGAAFGAIRLPEHLEQATDGNSNHRSARAAPLPNLLS